MSSLSKYVALALAFPAALSLSGCASRIGANQYTASTVGETTKSYRGIVISKRSVEVADAKKLSDNAAGAGMGALAGGVAGAQFGGGRGQLASGVAGALLGGVAGALIQDEMGKQAGFEYTVELDNGELRTVVQGQDLEIAVGQRVLLHESSALQGVQNKGTSRIVPLTQ